MEHNPSKRVLILSTAAFSLLAAVPTPAAADTLRHKDGTTIRGKIVHETPDLIRIETAYGTLSYPREELTKIEREGPAGGVPTPRVNYATVIPAGPVNPNNPPQVPPLVRFSARTTTAAATLAPVPAGIPTPVAPAVTAGPPAPPGTAPETAGTPPQ